MVDVFRLTIHVSRLSKQMANVKLNIEQFIKGMKSQQFLNKLALAAIRIIKKRTREGKDIKGASFKEYSKGYLKKREAAGLPNADQVNLRFAKRQSMMDAIDHEVANDLESVAVLFNDSVKNDLAYYHNVSGAGTSNVIRKFWGIELQEELDDMGDIGFKELEKIFKDLVLVKSKFE